MLEVGSLWLYELYLKLCTQTHFIERKISAHMKQSDNNIYMTVTTNNKYNYNKW